jgi:hypothetical protein
MSIDARFGMLCDQIIGNTKAMNSTGHVGRYNRLFTRRQRSIASLLDHADRDAGFRTLMDHPDPAVRLIGAISCRSLPSLSKTAEDILRCLAELPGEIGKSARRMLEKKDDSYPVPSGIVPKTRPFQAQPSGCSRDRAAAFIRTEFLPDYAVRIETLLRPCIRIWPKPASKNPIASRFGGMPAVPAGWSWPFENQEPLLFLGQIDCSAIPPLAGRDILPDRGLLSFFADHDDVMGCFPAGGGKVFYFSDIDALRPAARPLDDFEPLICCGLSFYGHMELPHPISAAVADLSLGKGQQEVYARLYEKISKFGLSDGVWESDISKFFGWPNLIQHDLGADLFSVATGTQLELLIQIGSYHDGSDYECWGPGGLLYFTLDRQSFTARRFEAAELKVQTT